MTSKQEDIELICYLIQTDSVDVKEKLIRKYNKFIRNIACQTPSNKYISFQDAYQISSIAFLEAAKRYDGTKNNTLITFTKRRLIGSIIDELRKKKTKEYELFQTTEQNIPFFDEHILDFDIRDKLMSVIETLTDIEQQVIKKLFFESKYIFEVATELNYTSSRICQIRDGALIKMKKKLQRHKGALLD